MYTEWIECNCGDFITRDSIHVNASNLHELLETFVQGHGIAFVVYEDELYHVALLMSRQKFGVEYVDCMANPQNLGQIKFEEKCRDLCAKHNIAFAGSQQLFSYRHDCQEYEFFPPQTAEQQFLGLYLQHKTHFHDKIKDFGENEKQRMVQFAERYSTHEGGDCIFWAVHIAYHLQKLPISAHQWFRTHHWFAEQDIMKAGSYILQYVTNNIFKSLLRCQLSKIKNRNMCVSRQMRASLSK